jgi:Xaa-Pro aminopeptidase
VKAREDALGNLTRLSQLLQSSSFDALLVASPEGVRYVGDVFLSTQRSIRHRPALILWPKGGDPVFVVNGAEVEQVREGSWITHIKHYDEFRTRPDAVLAEALLDLGLASARIATELDYLPTGIADGLRSLLPHLRLEDGDKIIRAARMVKTKRESALLRHACQTTEKALLATFISTSPGDDEFLLMRRLADTILKCGARSVRINHINGGARTALDRAGPSDYRLRSGDILKADCGGAYDEYLSNVGRTAKLGKPSVQEADDWERLIEIHEAVIQAVSPGRSAASAFDIARQGYERHGFPFPYSNNGHSIGLEVHERPILGPFDQTLYEPGMFTTVETRVRLPERGYGLHIEDLIEVTPDGRSVVERAIPIGQLLAI